LVRRTEDWYGDRYADALLFSRGYVATLRRLDAASATVPAGECIFAIKPALVTLLTDRISYVPPPAAASDAEFKDDIRKCRFAFLIPAHSPSYPEDLYPLRRLQGHFVPVPPLEGAKPGGFEVAGGFLVEIFTPF
jgi:hypothetical protein